MLLFAFTFLINSNKNPYVETVGLPVSGKTVVVDAGHGIPDEGAEVGDRYYRS